MKRLCLFLGLFLTSFFLYCNQSFAVSINVDNYFPYLNYLPDIRNTVLSYISNNSQYSDKYFIYFNTSDSKVWVILFSSATDFSGMQCDYANNSARFVISNLSNNSGSISYPLSSDYLSIDTSISESIGTWFGSIYASRIPLYSTLTENNLFTLTTANVNFEIIYSNHRYQSGQYYSPMPTLYRLGVDYNYISPLSDIQVVSDDTPILTSFYSIITDNLKLV